ncbi:unnamed protein product [Schistosoma curassoni]|uniref:Uncharacterized protein n=1 Tax=Schistosoma curassoni TaxID=6186 RepID=A0A183K650_9TREM|nr:unnamed protein product [Schistosoma curassoni]
MDSGKTEIKRLCFHFALLFCLPASCHLCWQRCPLHVFFLGISFRFVMKVL